MRSCQEKSLDEDAMVNPGRGALLLFKEDTAKHISSTERIPGRAVQIRLAYHTLNLRIISLYAPSAPSSSGREETLERVPKLCEWLSQARRANDQVALMGDLNGVLCPFMDRLNGTSTRPDYLQESLCAQGLSDLWRVSFPYLREFTHHSPTGAARLDYFLASEGILSRPYSAAIGLDTLETGSDHLPIFLEVSSIGLISPAPVVPRPGRLVLDREALLSSDWGNFTEMTEEVLYILWNAFDDLSSSPSAESLDVFWDQLECFLKSCAASTLKWKTVGQTSPALPLQRNGKLSSLFQVFYLPALWGPDTRLPFLTI